MSGPNSALVVGGGLAGITAAIGLAQRGTRVTLLEARPRLGGATYSFQRDSLTADTGQHVLLRCYSRYQELLARLGASDDIAIQDRLDVPVISPHHRPTRLRRGLHGPAPLHLLPALAGYRALPTADRIRAVLAASALRGVDPDDPASDAITFGAWLRRHGQTPAAVDRLWGLLCIAALNIVPEQASLALAARVFRTGLLDDVRAGDIGVPRVPLSRLHDAPARQTFARLGIGLHTGERVRGISESGPGLTVRTDTGEVDADAVVLAVPHAAAARLAPAAAVPDQRWNELGDAAIVNVHVLYDRPVTALPFAAVLGSGSWWVFDRTEAAGAAHGQYLVSSLSAAQELIGTPTEEIRTRHLSALAAVFPAARNASVVDSFVTREPRATFRQGAGTGALRPPAATRWPSLALAGAWTATGWPDTMEGAVRSGLAAVETLATSFKPQAQTREVIA
ncbi:hydroxysqualene dehydroxylase HpnE [Sinomonas humi]|uniref:Phytoene dehydrogenase n=1 Tax=Sinomonas humi TaxID=1338436 RepID=A0A0B2AGQ7_9MICC|nr:hydroxysqualene dehydroxylase HpnE [Sinomonas humi]KHL00967.1 phytoene dehydrogenase [Sinomonas humi]